MSLAGAAEKMMIWPEGPVRGDMPDTPAGLDWGTDMETDGNADRRRGRAGRCRRAPAARVTLAEVASP
jgi:hypothetical protein